MAVTVMSRAQHSPSQVYLAGYCKGVKLLPGVPHKIKASLRRHGKLGYALQAALREHSPALSCTILPK